MSNKQKRKASGKKYKSPMSKLVTFFENSRNKWKTKAKDAKYQIKLLRKKNKYIEQRKNELKELVRDLEITNKQMKDNEKRMQDEIERLKKNL